MKAKFNKPSGGKNYNIQFTEVNDSERMKIRALMNLTYMDVDPAWKQSHPFLQGDSDDWMMIEFWTNDLDKLVSAIKHAESELGTSIELDQDIAVYILSKDEYDNDESQFPESMTEGEKTLAESLLNLLGAFDNPITKRKVGNDFSAEAISGAKDSLKKLGVVSPLLS